jgi:hypothetical protein
MSARAHQIILNNHGPMNSQVLMQKIKFKGSFGKAEVSYLISVKQFNISQPQTAVPCVQRKMYFIGFNYPMMELHFILSWNKWW